MVSDMNYWSKVIKRLFSLALTLVLLIFILRLSVFYIPFLISFALALIFEPLIKKLMKKFKWTRRASSTFIIIISIAIIIAIVGWGVVTLFNEATNLLANSGEYINKIQNILNNITKKSTLLEKLPEELYTGLQNSQGELINTVSSWITNLLVNIKDWILKIPNLVMSIFFVIISLYFMCTDKIYIIDQLEHHLPDIWTKNLSKYIHKITKKLGHYLKAEATLILISFFISLIGFTIYKMIGLNVGFPLLISIGIAFVDALPILGSGAIMAPWAIIEVINGDIRLGILILVLWAIMGIVRNILEPKLVSKHIGIHPVFTIISMYTGYKLIGFFGMILGPIFLIVLKEIYTPLIDKGVLRSIFDRNS